MSKLESEIQGSIIGALEARGCFVLKTSLCNKNGFPDLTVLMPPTTKRNSVKIFCLEVKVPGEDPDPLQFYRHKELRGYGLETYTVYSKEEALQIFRGK